METFYRKESVNAIIQSGGLPYGDIVFGKPAVLVRSSDEKGG